jgi:branched-chain amino acid transport system permease protein
VLGAAFYVAAPQILRSFEQYETIIYGGLLLVIVIALPEGIIGLAQRAYARLGGPANSGGPSVIERFKMNPPGDR